MKNILIVITIVFLLAVGAAIIVFRNSTTSTTSRAENNEATNWQRIEDNDSRFDYGGENPRRPGFPYWDVLNSNGNYILSGDSLHACRTDINSGCEAILDLGQINFNQIKIGSDSDTNRSTADIYIDDIKIGTADSYNATPISNFNNYKIWTSPKIDCAPHDVLIIPTGVTGVNAKSFTIDFIDIQTCTPTQKTSITIDLPNTCQGNKNAPAGCFDCNGDKQVNILDFSCFRNRFGNSTN